MNVMDIKPRADTEYGQWEQWSNNLETILRQLNPKRKVIMVKQIYQCPICNKPTTFKWECDDCADPLGGDGVDD